MTPSVLSCLMLLISTGFVKDGAKIEFFEIDKGDDGKAASFEDDDLGDIDLGLVYLKGFLKGFIPQTILPLLVR